MRALTSTLALTAALTAVVLPRQSQAQAPAKPPAAPAAKPATPAAAGPPAAAAQKPGAPAVKAPAAPATAPAAPVPARPRPAPKPPAAALAKPSEPPATQAEVAALRSELEALREELKHAVGTPAPQADTAVTAKRAELEQGLASERQKLAAIKAAVANGLDESAVADSVTRANARIAELEASLAALEEPASPKTRSLSEVSADIERIDARLASEQPRPAASGAGDKVADKPTQAGTITLSSKNEQGEKETLPLEFTAFGDFFYRFARPHADAFGIGAVELDVGLALTPYVKVSTALAYSGQDETFDLAAFVVDCGLAGDGEHYLLQSSVLEASGLSFGRFDVPFGIAYLEYPSVDNRLITTPQAVLGTHGAWNDLGVQAYALGKYWTALAYLVNGPGIATADGDELPARTAVGGRASGKLDGVFELGGSLAGDFASGGGPLVFAGGDATAALGPLELRGEYLLKHLKITGAPDDTTGVYGRALVDLHPAYLVGRFDSLFSGSEVVDRRITAGGAFEVFPQGEVRAIYDQSLDSDERSVTLQLVGGSTFQPTGFRR